MAKRSRRYMAARAMVERGRRYPLSEAAELLQKLPKTKFDESVTVVVKLGIDPTKSDQLVRGSFSLPHGTGKEISIAVFAEGPKAEEAKEAGADHVGAADLAEKIQGGWTDFDMAIAHPSMMRVVGKLGRILGPQGKMPSPKSGTVVDAVGQAVKEFKAGKIEFRSDSGGNIHAVVGKRSFEPIKLADNVQALVDHLVTLRPSAAKGVFIKGADLASTMSPGIGLAVG